jgi:hypothetical protein
LAAGLRAVVDINAIYIQAKGKTFFANNILLDNPFVTDGFINESLEHLRQNVRITDYEIRFAAKRLKDNALFVARMFLMLVFPN